jgi:DNA-binding GntR family transcriptional regulator
METYEIGNSPLREALSRLSSTGIVKWEENRGFHVPNASRDGLMELMRTRCWLEEIALRRSIVGGDDKWEENLVVAFHWLNQASQDNDYENNTQSADWGLRHDGFHLALICACDSETLVTYCVQLQERTFRYSRLAELEKYCDRDELAEHRKLQDATLQRNADLAVSLLHEHFTKTCEILLASDRFRSE